MLQSLHSLPDPELVTALHAFEADFRYPLGQNRWFRISHGDDYTRFFRAIGEANCFVEVDGGRVNGVVSVTHCPLRMPSGDTVTAAYIADLKIRQGCGGRTLLRLLRQAVTWADRTPETPAFSIVMGGTARSPTSYTGRLGIPAYVELAKLTILRIPCLSSQDDGSTDVSLTQLHACFQQLSTESIASCGGEPRVRSDMDPISFVLNDQRACGVLENTRRCKRLYDDSGSEMHAAHLSCFGYHSTTDAVRLIHSATSRCHALGIPALFVAISQQDGFAVRDGLHIDKIVTAPATVFGTRLPATQRWTVNTAEI